MVGKAKLEGGVAIKLEPSLKGSALVKPPASLVRNVWSDLESVDRAELLVLCHTSSVQQKSGLSSPVSTGVSTQQPLIHCHTAKAAEPFILTKLQQALTAVQQEFLNDIDNGADLNHLLKKYNSKLTADQQKLFDETLARINAERPDLGLRALSHEVVPTLKHVGRSIKDHPVIAFLFVGGVVVAALMPGAAIGGIVTLKQVLEGLEIFGGVMIAGYASHGSYELDKAHTQRRLGDEALRSGAFLEAQQRYEIAELDREHAGEKLTLAVGSLLIVVLSSGATHIINLRKAQMAAKLLAKEKLSPTEALQQEVEAIETDLLAAGAGAGAGAVVAEEVAELAESVSILRCLGIAVDNIDELAAGIQLLSNDVSPEFLREHHLMKPPSLLEQLKALSAWGFGIDPTIARKEKDRHLAILKGWGFGDSPTTYPIRTDAHVKRFLFDTVQQHKDPKQTAQILVEVFCLDEKEAETLANQLFKRTDVQDSFVVWLADRLIKRGYEVLRTPTAFIKIKNSIDPNATVKDFVERVLTNNITQPQAIRTLVEIFCFDEVEAQGLINRLVNPHTTVERIVPLMVGGDPRADDAISLILARGHKVASSKTEFLRPKKRGLTLVRELIENAIATQHPVDRKGLRKLFEDIFCLDDDEALNLLHEIDEAKRWVPDSKDIHTRENFVKQKTEELGKKFYKHYFP